MNGFFKAVIVVLMLTIMIPVLSLLGELLLGIMYVAPMALVPIMVLVVLTFVFNKKKKD